MAHPLVAVLLTCHNRRARTLACLDALFRQSATRIRKEVFVIDSSSTDGTSEAIRDCFPKVNVFQAGSDIYWNAGMRMAFAYAHDCGPDYYLWLNDDVLLDKDGLARLLDANRDLQSRRSPPAIVVGSTRDPKTGELTYGGVIRPDWRRRMHYELVNPRNTMRQVETMNGNCVLIPSSVAARVGNLASVYRHGMGDFDYGHRAVRSGCEVWLVSGTVGTCARNQPGQPARTLRELLQLENSPIGGLPRSEWFTYARRWAGPFWFVFAVSPYARRVSRWVLQRGIGHVNESLPRVLRFLGGFRPSILPGCFGSAGGVEAGGDIE